MTETVHLSTGTSGNINTGNAVGASVERGHFRTLFSTPSLFSIFINLLDYAIESIFMKLVYNTNSGATANVLDDRIKIYV